MVELVKNVDGTVTQTHHLKGSLLGCRPLRSRVHEQHRLPGRADATRHGGAPLVGQFVLHHSRGDVSCTHEGAIVVLRVTDIVDYLVDPIAIHIVDTEVFNSHTGNDIDLAVVTIPGQFGRAIRM